MFGGTGNTCRRPYRVYNKWFKHEKIDQLLKQSRDAEHFFRRSGITFNIQGNNTETEHLIPFDIVPRILSGKEWGFLERGLKQRAIAINMFLSDIYHKQEIIRAGKFPFELVKNNTAFLSKMVGFSPPGNIYTHVLGLDIVRVSDKQFFVLEDNVRTPSGVSYMLENRETMLRMFPELFSEISIKPVKNYPRELESCLAASKPKFSKSSPAIAVLTPGLFNSAYYEHASLAEQMGVELVESQDVRIVNGKVAVRTTQGYDELDVLYRRIDDQFLDPLNFNPNSLISGG